MAITAAALLRLAEGFDWKSWQAKWGTILEQHERSVVTIGGEAVAKTLGNEFSLADPFTSTFMTGYVGERITSLDATTRDDVAQVIRRALDNSEATTAFDIGTEISDAVSEKFDGYERWRADRIARTETAIAYNHGTVLGTAQAGVTQVEVSDGDDDEECAAVDGQIWTIDDALSNPVAHPNCTRAFAPYVADDSDDTSDSESDLSVGDL